MSAMPEPIATQLARRKPSRTSPTQRSLEHMRAQGYLCAVVERWNPHAMVRQDLYGFIDILCVKGSDIVGVQACASASMAARVAKIIEHENWPLVQPALTMLVQGWRKNAAGRWVLREIEL
jgi:hypothetical protein